MGLSVLHFILFSRGLSVWYTTTSPTTRPMPDTCAYKPLVVMYPVSGGLQRRAQKSFITCLLCIFPAAILTSARVGYLSRIVVIRTVENSPNRLCSFTPQCLCICFPFLPRMQFPSPARALDKCISLKIQLDFRLLFKALSFHPAEFSWFEFS